MELNKLPTSLRSCLPWTKKKLQFPLSNRNRCFSHMTFRLTSQGLLSKYQINLPVMNRKKHSLFGKGWGLRFLSSTGHTCIEEKDNVEIEDKLKTQNRKPHLHVPVMKDEVLRIFNPQSGQTFLDMTFGAGGHTRAILDTNPHVKVIALDRDPLAYGIANNLQKQYGERLIPVQGKFSELHDLLSGIGVEKNSLDGALLDCGASSMQFEMTERGFSVVRDGPLDMRMDWNRDPAKPTAADVVNYSSEQNLFQILRKYGEEKKARAIAQAIVDHRYTYGKFETTRELAKTVNHVFEERAHRRDKLMRHAHVATKTFQALRIFVNDEMNELHNGLEQVYNYLKPSTGVCVAISFHSLEDRIIKRHFHGIEIDADVNMKLSDHVKLRGYGVSHSSDEMNKIIDTKWTPLSKRISVAEEEEVQRNPRARSAKLRAAAKLS